MNSLAGKLQNRNGKKRENNVLPKSPSGGPVSGSAPVGFKNSKLWVSKNRGSDKKLQKTVLGYAGSGTNRKNDHQVNKILLKSNIFNSKFLFISTS